MFEWLLASIDQSRAHDIGFEVSWHARSMVLAWSVVIPLGIISARFFKVLPSQDWPNTLDNQVWWHVHRTFQYLGGVLMFFGVWLIWDVSGQKPNGFLHQLMGWTTIILCGVQYTAAWLRGSKGGPTEPELRGDHFDMTRRRVVFEYLHKTVGYVCLITSLIAVFSGLWIANAPHWMWIALIAWWIILIFVFSKLHKKIGAIDTYQAIWGNDPDLPGNKKQPIGVHVKRINDKAE